MAYGRSARVPHKPLRCYSRNRLFPTGWLLFLSSTAYHMIAASLCYCSLLLLIRADLSLLSPFERMFRTTFKRLFVTKEAFFDRVVEIDQVSVCFNLPLDASSFPKRLTILSCSNVDSNEQDTVSPPSTIPPHVPRSWPSPLLLLLNSLNSTRNPPSHQLLLSCPRHVQQTPSPSKSPSLPSFPTAPFDKHVLILQPAWFAQVAQVSPFGSSVYPRPPAAPFAPAFVLPVARLLALPRPTSRDLSAATSPGSVTRLLRQSPGHHLRPRISRRAAGMAEESAGEQRGLLVAGFAAQRRALGTRFVPPQHPSLPFFQIREEKLIPNDDPSLVALQAAGLPIFEGQGSLPTVTSIVTPPSDPLTPAEELAGVVHFLISNHHGVLPPAALLPSYAPSSTPLLAEWVLDFEPGPKGARRNEMMAAFQDEVWTEDAKFIVLGRHKSDEVFFKDMQKFLKDEYLVARSEFVFLDVDGRFVQLSRGFTQDAPWD